MKKHRTSKQGLTLIEVLVALIILSVGVSSLMLAMARCLSVIQTARHREVARNLMVRVDIENPIEKVDMDEMSDSGEFSRPVYGNHPNRMGGTRANRLRRDFGIQICSRSGKREKSNLIP